MTRRNGGVFEPEFRLVMVILVAFSTVMGLWGFGWSAQVEDPWIAPTVFFGVIGIDTGFPIFIFPSYSSFLQFQCMACSLYSFSWSFSGVADL
jgi:hypothetical protein